MLENRLQDHDAGQLRLWKIKPRLDVFLELRCRYLDYKVVVFRCACTGSALFLWAQGIFQLLLVDVAGDPPSIGDSLVGQCVSRLQCHILHLHISLLQFLLRVFTPEPSAISSIDPRGPRGAAMWMHSEHVLANRRSSQNGAHISSKEI